MAKSTWNISDPIFESDALNKAYRLDTSPWAGHRNFAYDLVNFVKPRTVLELGTHFGCSFFAFTQAVKDLKLKTKVIAIDTWKGDEHAGKYGDEVFDTVQATTQKAFKQIDITLIRELFSIGLAQVTNESADIIHIDGLHTYEAVKQDFADSLPKLMTNGIMLFHDTAYADYGSSKFWLELKSKYPSFEFQHSWGLGVLFPKGDKWHKELINQNFTDKVKIYEYKAQMQRAMLEVTDLTAMANERLEGIDQQSKMIDQRDQEIKGLSKDLAHSTALLQQSQKQLEKIQTLHQQSEDALAEAKKRNAKLEEYAQYVSSQLEQLNSQLSTKLLRKLKLIRPSK